MRLPLLCQQGVVLIALFCWAIAPGQTWLPQSNITNTFDLFETMASIDVDVSPSGGKAIHLAHVNGFSDEVLYRIYEYETPQSGFIPEQASFAAPTSGPSIVAVPGTGRVFLGFLAVGGAEQVHLTDNLSGGFPTTGTEVENATSFEEGLSLAWDTYTEEAGMVFSGLEFSQEIWYYDGFNVEQASTDDPVNPLYESQLTYDAFGNAHIVFTDSANEPEVWYGTNFSGTWKNYPVTGNDFDDYTPDIQLDQDGYVHIVWSQENASGDFDLYYTNNIGADFPYTNIRQLTFEDSDAFGAAMIIDENDVIHIVYYATSGVDDGQVFYLNSEDDFAAAVQVSDPMPGHYYQMPALDVDAAGYVHIAYQGFTDSGTDIYYRTNDPDGPVILTAVDETETPSIRLSAEPNPFKHSTLVRYNLNRQTQVQIQVFDLAGNVVANLVDAVRPAGDHKVPWDMADIPRGVYLLKMNMEGDIRSVRLMKD